MPGRPFFMSLTPPDVPHVLMMLLPVSGYDRCLHAWREPWPLHGVSEGEYLPLPDGVVEAAGWEIDAAAEVERVFVAADLTAELRALLAGPLPPECLYVFALRALTPEVTEDGFVSLGLFDPRDARPLLALLEEHSVAFQLDADHSQLKDPGRTAALFLGMFPTGSQVEVFVLLEDLPHARRLLRYLYPPERPPVFPAAVTPAKPAAAPAMEVYTPPATALAPDGESTFRGEGR